MERPVRTATTLPETGAAGTLRRTATSHIGFRVADVEANALFYTRVLGMQQHAELPGGGLRLGWGSGHHVLDLVPGGTGPGELLHFGFEVRDVDGVDGIARRLTEAGIAYEELDPDYLDAAIGKGRGIVVRCPDGIPVHFHTQVHRSGENSADTGRRPVKFQHTTVGTADVAAMVSFFVGVVGFRISDQLDDGRFCWLRSDADHHTLAVVDVGASRLDHYSYDLAEWEDFRQWCDRLTDLDVPVAWGPGRHGPGNNLFVFFDDPAGTHIELSAEMEKFRDEHVTYAPRQWENSPFSVNMWGGQVPRWRVVDADDDARSEA